MKTRRGWVQGYNAQAVVTPDQIILAAHGGGEIFGHPAAVRAQRWRALSRG